MRNSTVLIVVAAATAAVAAPIVNSEGTRASASATPTAVFPDGFTMSVRDKDKENTEDDWVLTDEEFLRAFAAWRKQQEAEDYEEQYKRALGARDGARKHGVACVIL